MFRNRFRKYAFATWVVAIPIALIGGLLKSFHAVEPIATLMIAGGIACFIIGLVVLKIGGGARA